MLCTICFVARARVRQRNSKNLQLHFGILHGEYRSRLTNTFDFLYAENISVNRSSCNSCSCSDDTRIKMLTGYASETSQTLYAMSGKTINITFNGGKRSQRRRPAARSFAVCAVCMRDTRDSAQIFIFTYTITMSRGFQSI